MRSIPASLAAKVRDLQQTRANNNDPRLQAILTRHQIPLIDFDMWQRSTIPGISPTKTSIAVRRPSAASGPDAAYVGAVENGVSKVFMGSIHGVTPPSEWVLKLTLDDAFDIALAFDGKYIKWANKVEFVTGDLWVFWITAAGAVYGKTIDDAGAGIKLATDAASISAIMGVAATVGSVSQGLILAWSTFTGDVLTRQYYGGMWEDGVLCPVEQFNVVSVALSRTWDYRVAMQLKDIDGKVFQLLGKSMISGNANIDALQVTGVNLSTDVFATTLRNSKLDDENVSVSAIIPRADIYSAIAPMLINAHNIDDGTGNWGQRLRVVFSGPVYDIAGQAASFRLANQFTGEAIAYDPADPDGKTLLLTMADFNNAPSPSVLTYTPGTLASGPSVTLVDAQSISVNLAGLVPTNPPIVTGAEVLDNRTIVVTFNESISSTDISSNLAAIMVTGTEPAYSPSGEDVPTTYAVESVSGASRLLTIDPSSGMNIDTQFTEGALKLGVNA